MTDITSSSNGNGRGGMTPSDYSVSNIEYYPHGDRDQEGQIEDLVKQVSQLNSEIKEILKTARIAVDDSRSDFMDAVLYELEMRLYEKARITGLLRDVERSSRQAVMRLMEDVEEERNMHIRNNLSKVHEATRLEGSVETELEIYDWVVDISLLSDVSRDGWKVYFSRRFDWETVDLMTRVAPLPVVTRTEDGTVTTVSAERPPRTANEATAWEGAVVAVVGLYDKGKTFVLNNITNSALPSGKRVSTKGLSFKHVDVDAGTHLIIIDTAGSYSPVKVVNDLSVVEKEASELFLLELIFELADYFICVVNDFTSLDQRYLDRLSRNLQNSTKDFREVIVVHNLKEVTSADVLSHMWKTQVTYIYGSGKVHRTKVAALPFDSNILIEKHVEWFKTDYTRHICLANDDAPLGAEMNPWAFSLLRYWLKAVFVPVDRKFSVVESVLHFCNIKLSNYFKTPVKLNLVDGANKWEKYIRSETQTDEPLRLPQVSIDASGIMLTRPDSFMPAVDITKGDQYRIYMDIPGLSRENIALSRQNVVTIVKGARPPPYDENSDIIERRERKYGEFTMTFRIPEHYERKWSSITVENGVCCIVFRRDEGEGDPVTVSPQHFNSMSAIDWGRHPDSYL
eukprot:GFYU01008587.1.p1 GENE.GFYU01008587.1~~GFYU01008587.1.p1  ORF type:complete len:626 (-),score=141.67 GFYU01008587.1:72-1949(-)